MSLQGSVTAKAHAVKLLKTSPFGQGCTYTSNSSYSRSPGSGFRALVSVVWGWPVQGVEFWFKG